MFVNRNEIDKLTGFFATALYLLRFSFLVIGMAALLESFKLTNALPNSRLLLHRFKVSESGRPIDSKLNL